MAKRVQRRRGTTSEHTTFTGYDGETTVDTSKDTVVVHDGSVAGGFPLAREDMSNVINQVGVTQLDLVDGTAEQVIKTDGSGTISFGTIDVAGATMGALGGDIEGTVANALIKDNKVGITELNVSDGTVGQALITDGSGTLSFGDVLTDPALGGHLSGTTSAATINQDTITSGMLTTALKNFTIDEFTGVSAQTTFTLSASVGSTNALLVYIDGIVQPTTAYALPTATSIQFITAPPVSSIIRCLHLGFQSTVGVPSDGTVTTAKLAANAVTSTKILDGTIATADIADDAITDAKIAAQTITEASILPNTITSISIANDTITSTQILDNSIDGTKIALGSDAQGDIMYYDGTNWVRLAAGTATHVLTTTGAGANPYWAAGSSGTALPSVGSSGNVLTSDGSNWSSQLPYHSGQMIQMQYDASTRRHAVATGTNSQVYQTDTLPTIALGDQFMNVNITPKNASNILVVEHTGMYSDSSIYGPLVALFAGNYCIGVSYHFGDQQANNDVLPQTVKSTFLVSESGWTSGVLAITARATGSGTITFNGLAGNRLYNTAPKSSLVVTEYSP